MVEQVINDSNNDQTETKVGLPPLPTLKLDTKLEMYNQAVLDGQMSNRNHKKVKDSIFRRNYKSIAPTIRDRIDSIFTNAKIEDEVVQKAPEPLSRFKERTKSILNLNRQCSTSRMSIDPSLKLMGADLRKSLKAKIDDKLKLYQNIRTSNASKAMERGFGMRNNPFVKERSSLIQTKPHTHSIQNNISKPFTSKAQNDKYISSTL